MRGTTAVEASRSVDIGCVRMTERHLRSDPPTPSEVEAAARDIDAAIDVAASAVDFTDTAALVGLAGSVTTITAHALGLPVYDAQRIHLTEMTPEDTLRACASLLHMTRAERAALPFMHPGRVDVIGAGALIWHQVVQRVAAESRTATVITSEHDILDGIALSCAG